MYHVKTMNKISKIGLAELDDRFEISDTMEHEDAILVRSAKLHDYDFPAELLCIARAGAGVNNIPLDRAAEAGIVVFNTPGANANGVKELTIAALLLASRKISQGITWVKEQAAAGADVAAVVEKGKAAYVGPEIQGKTLGVVGLGAIGVLVANAAAALGMQIVGYDPFLSVQHALNLTPEGGLHPGGALRPGRLYLPPPAHDPRDQGDPQRRRLRRHEGRGPHCQPGQG